MCVSSFFFFVRLSSPQSRWRVHRAHLPQRDLSLRDLSHARRTCSRLSRDRPYQRLNVANKNAFYSLLRMSARRIASVDYLVSYRRCHSRVRLVTFSYPETRTSNRYGNIYNGQRSMFALMKEFLAMSSFNRLTRRSLVESTSAQRMNSSTIRRVAASSSIITHYKMERRQFFTANISRFFFHNQYLNTKYILLKSYLSTS